MSVTELATTAHDALLRPVRESNVFESTVERILQLIKLGVVSAGDRLPPERELALRLGVSRVTVREAIRALQQAGFVVSRRGRYGGTFVRSVPSARNGSDLPQSVQALDDLEDTLAFREVVEGGAAEQAGRRPLTAAEVSHLEHMLELTSAASLADYRRADSRLHLAIAELSGSPSVTATVADGRMRINELLDTIPLLDQNIANSDDQHIAIVRAVLAGRPTRARRAMTEHLEGTAALLRAFLD
jgi:DNA-binding FadR family transcriptional regulator